METNFKEEMDKIITEQADLRGSVENVVASQDIVIKAMVIIRKAQENNNRLIEEMGNLIKVMSDEIRSLKK